MSADQKKYFMKKPKHIIVDDVLYYKKMYDEIDKELRKQIAVVAENSREIAKLRARAGGLTEAVRVLLAVVNT